MSAARRWSGIRAPIDADGINAPVKSDEWWLELAIRQQERFWAKVQKHGGDACWLWQAGKDKDGYGKHSINAPRENGRHVQKHVRAHRIAWEMAHGLAPARLVVGHRCGNYGCVRPAHLFLGTVADIRTVSVIEGRTARGEKNGNARFTEDQVRELLLRTEAGARLVDAARTVGIPYRVAWTIAKDRSWRHVEADVRAYRPNLSALLAERRPGCCVACDEPLSEPEALVCAQADCFELYDGARRQDYAARVKLKAEITPKPSLLGGI